LQLDKTAASALRFSQIAHEFNENVSMKEQSERERTDKISYSGDTKKRKSGNYSAWMDKGLAAKAIDRQIHICRKITEGVCKPDIFQCQYRTQINWCSGKLYCDCMTLCVPDTLGIPPSIRALEFVSLTS